MAEKSLLNIGDRALVGQKTARERVGRILNSGRLGHSYLLTGPSGSGKKALALAFAEAINGINNLSTLGNLARSKKSSWFNHPDIHMFLPIPSKLNLEEMRSRLQMLNEDPYEIVDFSIRPSLDQESSENRQTFYPIDYFRDSIKPVTMVKPNEGEKTIIILDEVDRMKKEAANAFLKLLEEPSPNLMFILTASHPENLLPTVISRCQIVQLQPLTPDEIEQGLVELDGKNEENARYLARISDGNFALTRFYDIDTLKQTREEIIAFLRNSYQNNAPELIAIIEEWNGRFNIEGKHGLLNIMETFIRDLIIYKATESEEAITNIDQIKVIKNFVQSLKKARLEEMINEIQKLKPALLQNVQFKYILTVLAFRFRALMLGNQPFIDSADAWKHIPAFDSQY